MKILYKIEETIKKFKMLRKGDTVCAAVSGGVDSTALLYALAALKKELGIKVVACHLNHNLRGAESNRDERFVKSLAKKLKVPYVGKKLTKKEVDGRDRSLSVQQWARVRRHEFLRHVAKRRNARVIATGHNRDDQAETVLMRLIKGSGARGLVGIEPVRRPFIRPLIAVTRSEINSWAATSSIKYVKDSSNQSRKYLRNRLRLDLIPFIEKEYNPGFKDALVRAASSLSADEAYLAGEAAKALKGALKAKKRGSVTLDRQALLKLDESIQFRLFQQAAAMAGTESGLYAAHFDAFRALLGGKRPNFTVDLPGGLVLGREYEHVTVSRWSDTGYLPFIVELTVPGETRVGPWLIGAQKISKMPSKRLKSSNTAYFDMDYLPPGPIVARNFLPGDRLRPLGMAGTKKVKDIFIDAKVPPHERERCPIVTSGEAILWVAGLRQSGEFKVTGKTRRVLRLSIDTP